ncbi:MAG: SpaA isopeptide-forming pilin-related protein, partial [Clostridium sp.]
MYRQNKKKLAITVVMFFITLMFSNFTTISASADTTSTVGTIKSGPYSITTTFTNGSGNTQNVYDVGSIVSIGVNITRIGTVSSNDTIKITVPNALDTVNLDSSGLKGYFKVTQEETSNGEILTLTPLANAANLVNAQLHIGGILSKDLTSGDQNIPITVNGTTNEIPVNVNNPSKPAKKPDTKPNDNTNKDKPNTSGGSTTPDKPHNGDQTNKPDKPNSGGSTTPVGPYSGVNWGNGIDKYIVTSNGISKTMTIPTVDNNSVQYELFVNTDGVNGNQTITDNLPNGETYEPNSLEVYKYTADNNDPSPNLAAQYSASTQGGKLVISGFTGGTGKYRILYKVKLSNSIGYDQNLQNIAYYNGKSSTATVSANTQNSNAGINWKNHVDKYIITGSSRGIAKTMTIPTVNNNVEMYKIFIDTDGLSGNQTLTDDLPNGLSYVPNSVQVCKFENNQTSTTNIASQFKISTKNNVLSVSGFQGGTGKYVVFYNVNVSNDLGYDQTLNNVAKLAGDTSSASITVNTIKSSVTPGQESHMISKTVDPTVFTKDTQQLNYTININPNHITAKNIDMVDKLPQGITLQPLQVSMLTISNLQVSQITPGQYMTINIEEISPDGTVSYPVGNYPQSEVQATLIYDMQNNTISFKCGSTSENIQIQYSANIKPGATNIENTATIKNNGLTASSTATSQYYSGSSALGFSKAVNKAQILQGQNPDVAYTLNINSTGYYPNGYLKFSDPLEKGIKVEGVQVPKGFSYTIDKSTNTINFENSSEIDPGNYNVVIDASLAAFRQGTTVNNTAYVGQTPSNTVSTKVGYGFKAIKEAEKTHAVLQGAEYGVYQGNSEQPISTVTSNKDGVMYGSVAAPGNYYLKEIQAPKGYSVSDMKIPFTITNNNLGTTVEIPTIYDTVAPVSGNIKIIKTDATTNKPLAGAIFEVEQNGKMIQQPKSTNDNGIVEFTGLPVGQYTIVEIKAPAGYEKAAVENADVTAGQTTLEKISDKEITGNIKVVKTDKQTGKPLAGAVFTLTGPNGFKAETATTDVNGVATFGNLPWGTYSVQETTAPTGYKLDNKVYSTTINASSFNAEGIFQVPTFNVADNEVLGSLQIVKTGVNNSRLQGAEFTVTGPNGYKEVVTTNKEGVANLDKLVWGTYNVQETKAPAGYNLDNNIQTVTIDANDTAKLQTVTVDDAETTGTLVIEKTDLAGTKEIAGATIQIQGTSDNGQKIDIPFTSGTTPSRFVLPAGKYTYTEIKAPTGYQVNKTVGQFTISKQGQIVKVDVKDANVLGKMSITKTNANGTKMLQGAEFTVTGPNGFDRVVTTNKDGVASLDNLAWGNYNVQETKAPVGYAINNEVQTVNINANDAAEVQAVKLADGVATGTLVIEKTDITNEKEVAGAKIQIGGTSISGEKIDKTFVSGTTPTKFTLPAGTYTYTEVDAPVGYQINKTVGHFTISEQGQIVKADVKDARVLGSMQIVKTGINGAKLSGAEFTVTGPNGYKEVVTTNNEGVANLDKLAWGTYNVQETKAPAGYNLENNIQTVTIDANDAAKLQTVTVNDAETTGTLVIEKTDITNEKEVAGAKIQIQGTSDNGQKIDKTFVSGTTPTKFTLPAGRYTYTEVDAPVGYQINKTVGHFTISKQGQIVKADVKDARVLGQMSITKTNENGTKKLQGAQFTVTGPNGFDEVVTTNADGVANLKDLAWGTYNVQETKAPVGYAINNEVQTVDINAKDVAKVQAVTLADGVATGTLVIEKTDITNEKEVAGAKIQIQGTSISGEKIDKTFVSGTTPTKFTLPAGKYTYTEVDAPVGYQINKTVGHFIISEQGQIVKADVKDARDLGSMQIVKTGLNNSRLQGAEFTVTGPNGFDKVVTTNKDGVANLDNLAWGTYSVKETKAPAGYNLNT